MNRAALGVLVLLAGCAGEPPRPRDPVRDWLEICADHGYTQTEMALATGLEAPEVGRRIAAYGIKTEGRPAPKPFTILPYPGGRHPRIGFLEGAVDPQRDTKFSLFLPGGGYVVIDLPEAVWRDVDAQPKPKPRLIYLAHTHIKTYWEEKGIKPDKIEWTRRSDGGLESRRVLPDGVEFSALARPAADGVEMELRMKNGTAAPIANPWAQVCVMLKGATGFNAQTKENKLLIDEAGACAVRSEDGKRWIVTVFERPKKIWQNPPVPCIHSEPSFPDLAPGQEAVSRGRVFYWEGEDLRNEVSRRRAAKSLIP